MGPKVTLPRLEIKNPPKTVSFLLLEIFRAGKWAEALLLIEDLLLMTSSSFKSKVDDLLPVLSNLVPQ